jgi:phosphoketolase
LRNELYPDSAAARVFVTHTRPETILGVLHPLDTGSARTAGIGYIAQGGTLTTSGLLFVNRCTWAHILAAAARILDLPREDLLTPEELAALDGRASPEGVIV